MDLYSQAKYIEIDGVKLCYSDTGNSEHVIVFLHGMGSNLKAWRKNISYLSQHHRCIAIDFPGYGRSEKGQGKSDVRQSARLIEGIITKLSLSNVTLVGHSMGGLISVLVANSCPSKIDNIVLVAPAGVEEFSSGEIEVIKTYFTGELIASYSKQMITKNFELNFYDMPDDARFMIKERHELARDVPAFRLFCDTVSESTLSIVNNNIKNIIQELELPIILFFGENDRLIPHHIMHPDRTTLEIAEATDKIMKNGQLIFYKKCGHFIQWEKSEEVNNHISKLITVSS